MKNAIFLSVILLFSLIFVAGKVVVEAPESAIVTTKDLVLHLSNQLDQLPNNDAVSYIAITVANRSSRIVRLVPEDFLLKDETGKVIPRLSGKEALKAVVEWNYEKAHDYIRIGDADLHDVLRLSNEPTFAKALTEIELKPQEEVKNKAVFFQKIPAGKFTFEFESEKIQLRVGDGVYFVRPEGPKVEGKVSR
ncbi:MAG TPA: hypothetical protein VGL91_01565 [Acidobacteriota bacterium]|jgi:hypothetical protein